MLATYLSQTRFLLANPAASTNLYSDTAVTQAINLARRQIAGEGECIRRYLTMPLVNGVRSANFSAITLPSGVQGILNIKQVSIQVNDGASYVHPRPFQWLNLYYLSQINPESGRPTLFAQYAQGAAGSLYFNPVPDDDYTANVDCVAYPIDLVDDSTVEAIPFPWTDCVAFYACYYLYNSAQRAADADRFYKQYEEYMRRARSMSNPSVISNAYSQSADPTLSNKLAMQQGNGQ